MLTWAEIVTRIDGLRQLRGLVDSPRIGMGSFDPEAAGQIASLDDGVHGVNPTGLGNRKAVGSKAVAVDDTHGRAS